MIVQSVVQLDVDVADQCTPRFLLGEENEMLKPLRQRAATDFSSISLMEKGSELLTNCYSLIHMSFVTY